MNYLKDNWEVTGKSLEDFKNEVQNVVSQTTCVSVMSNSMENVAHDGIYTVKEYADGIFKVRNALTGVTLSMKGVNALLGAQADELAEELLATNRVILRFYGNTYFLSDLAFFTLKERLGFKTSAMDLDGFPEECMGSLIESRNVFMANLFKAGKTPIKLITKTMGKGKGSIHKVFAVNTDKYEYIPQSVVLETAEDICLNNPHSFGTGIVSQYTISHEYTEVYIEFPDAEADIKATYGVSLTPVVRITTSDIGMSSFHYQALWKRGNSYLTEAEVPIKHQGKNANAAAIKEALENKLYPKFSQLPERLCDLATVFITTDTISEKEAEDTLAGLLKALHRDVDLVAATTKKIEMEVKDLLLADFAKDSKNYSLPITALDVALKYMELEERLVGLERCYRRSFEKAIGKIPYSKKLEKTNAVITNGMYLKPTA